MKIIINESQLKYIFEQTNPCPKGVKESPLYTTKDLEKGQKLSKGYCNSNPNSALVVVQKELQKNILTQTFPNVPVVDASLQMARELERLQRQAGSLSAKDLESVLQAVGMALPDGQSLSGLDFQAQGAGEIRLQGLQLSNEQQTQFVQALRTKGYEAQLSERQWRIVGKPKHRGGA